MFKKLIFLLMTILMVMPVEAQDQAVNIDLDVNNQTPCNKDFEFCHLAITSTQLNPSTVTIYVNLENTDVSNYSLLLFGFAYDEKTLKKQNIKFDKKSYGTTSKNIMVCKGVSRDEIMRIDPSRNRVLTFEVPAETKTKIELPIYFAKADKKKLRSEKYMIRQRAVLTLNISLIFPDENDDEYEDIKSQYDELIEKIESSPICPGKRHPESEQAQIEKLQEEIDNLKDKITDIKSEHHWKERDEAYKPYKELVANLNKIEFKKELCSKCANNKPRTTRPTNTTAHDCNYCSKSPSDILRMLQRTYQELDNRKIKKADAIMRVESAHKAWTKGCSNLKKKMDADSDTKYKVSKYYDAIVNY